MSHYTYPDLSQYQALKNVPVEQGFDQLVLVRLRPEAVYADGETGSAAEAYATYQRALFAALHAHGVRPVWRGRMLLTLIGPSDESWDECYTVRFPTAADYRGLLGDTAYTDASVHWNACVEDCRVYCLTVEPGLGV